MQQRVRALLENGFEQIATVAEMAAACGLSIDELVRDLAELFDSGVLAIEAAESELYVLPYPKGRPKEGKLLAVNVWEQLRSSRSVIDASKVCRSLRSLERGGWSVFVDPSRWNSRWETSGVQLSLGVVAGGGLVPVLVGIGPSDVSNPDGPVSALYRAGSSAVAVSCPQHALESYVTEARRWFLRQVTTTTMTILILEAPRYQPVIVQQSDTAVNPISVVGQNDL
jgi:hypothetical protein